jgi:GGDEF domain-containing protein
VRGKALTDLKTQLAPAEVKQAVTSWLDQLSEKQTVAVAPLLKALSGLMSEHKGEGEQIEHAAPSISPVTEAACIGRTALDSLERILSRALESADPQTISDSMLKCLEIVRTEKAKPTAVPALPAITAGALTVDAETGLPGRLSFEKLIAKSITEGKNAVTALFVVERLPLINKRFGRVVGDRVLLYVAKYLAQELPDSNSLSRWSGPAFSTIINADNSDSMESQIRAISNKPLSANIDVDNRSVMLTISCACMIEQLSAQASPEKVFDKMDEFVKTRTSS